MKILMICKGEYYEFMPAIAEALKRRGCSVSAMTFATPTSRLAKMETFDQIHNLAAYLKNHVPRYDLDECIRYLQNLEFSGEVANLNVMTYADRIIRDHPFDRVMKILTGICRFWDELFSELRPEAVVGEVACAAEWIAWSFAQRSSIPYLIPYPGPLPRRFYFITSPAGRWDLAETLYHEAKGRGLSEGQAREAEDFLSVFRTSRLRSAIHAPAFRSPVKVDRAGLSNLIERARRIPFRTRTYLEDGNYEVGSYNGTLPWSGVARDLLRIVRHVLSHKASSKTPVPKERKVYFPLHVQPEFTIDVRAPFCTNQLALVEKVAKSLPAGYRLVVKDHPGMRGYRPLHYYRELRQLYNVELVSPSMDSHEIIQTSDAVVAIVGTTAWESILYEKPVVALGPLAYNFFDLVYNCSNVSDLPAILSEAIHDFSPNRDLLLKFLWAVLQSAHHGEWHDPLATPSILEQENVENISKCILEDIARMKAREAITLPV